MPICSYLMIPEPGTKARVQERLDGIAGCEVVPAENRDILILVTETEDRTAEDALRARLETLDGVRALMQTFGEVEVG